jgi:transcription-repair coupling factor (superfamily II helicase)
VTARWIASISRDPRVEAARASMRAGQTVSISGPTGPLRLLLPLLAASPPIIVVVPRERDVEEAAEDLRTLAEEAGCPGSVHAFPTPGPPPYRGLPRHADASLRRATALRQAARRELLALVASPAGLLRPCLAPALFETRVVALQRGDEMTPEILQEALDEGGYVREDPVSSPGQMARRGGILDLFPPNLSEPVRLEFAGDTIDSLRSFDPESQRSRAELEGIEVFPLSDLFVTRTTAARLCASLVERYPAQPQAEALAERLRRGPTPEEALDWIPLVPGATVPVWEHLPGAALALLEPEEVDREAVALHARAREDRVLRKEELSLEPEIALVTRDALLERTRCAPALHLTEVEAVTGGLHIASRPVRRYMGDVRALAQDLRIWQGATTLLLGSPGRAARMSDLLTEEGFSVGEPALLEVRVGALSSGVELPDLPVRVLADGDIFPEEVRLHARGRSRSVRSFLSDFRDLRIGDLVVHQDHGVGRFEGLQSLEIAGATREFMVLGYRGGDRLKVPVEAFDRIQKHGSAEATRPSLDRLGGGSWDKVKRRVKRAMQDMAAELLRLYAERKARPGHAFSGASPWQKEFEEAFEYEETPDQAAAIESVAADMAGPSPMDRLVCGDVGYGKTEVAMRAAMRAVLDGKQVAMLAPTTVLAFQHWRTLQRRFAPFPVTIEMVSRFRTAREIKAALRGVREGRVDVLIGTHRLLSKDVEFRDLGLLVIDEEQRFGVAAKERLKRIRTSVDCLTLSATPIPRTLQMGLAGLRDMSVIETPPKDRLAIQTAVVRFSTDVIAAAIRQELARAGQVYFVHHRVESIYSVANLVSRLVPEARVAVAHGQMPEVQLEAAMLAFVEGRADVLVATTLIENGLDIPRANTLVVNRADRYGLAQLYQLRGRVGRSDRRAYAYLLIPPDRVLSEIARKRLAAIREFSDLGAGFRIAALDLELRGAGNLLGGEQSGHIQAVGLDLYVQLLDQAIQELRGEAPREAVRAALNLRLDLRIPEQFVPDAQQRIGLYKRISEIGERAGLVALRSEIRDRYGAPPPEVESLLGWADLRLRAEAAGIAQVDKAGANLVVRWSAEPSLSAEALVSLVEGLRGAALSPDSALRVQLASGEAPSKALEAILALIEAARAAPQPAPHL